MNAVFSQTGYVLKQQGHAISGKYCLYDQNDNPLLYIEEKVKWIPLVITHISKNVILREQSDRRISSSSINYPK